MRQSPTTAALFAAFVLAASPVRAEVPVPRLAPAPGVTTASIDSGVTAEDRAASLEEQIEREVAVDVSLSVADFYAKRHYRPIWTDAREAAVRERLAGAAYDGFDPADYFVPETGLSRAATEVSLTEAVLRYARHAMSGRAKPLAISPIMTIEPPKLDEVRFLARLARAEQPLQVLERLHPSDPQFVALRAKLAESLGNSREAPPAVGAGANLKLGSREPRVAVLRSRLNATVARGADPTVFDDSLDAAVRVYQASRGLRADGIVGPQTIRILDEGLGEDAAAALISNMERWRWLPRDLGALHVFVNVPAYRVAVVSDGRTIYDGKVIVGAVDHPTPIFSDEIEHIVVNPYWNVPISIASNEMLGAIQQNPRGYFARRGYEAVYDGRVVDPGSLNWHRGMLHKVRIRQVPGEANALGAVKFMFPNQHAVYLHDTPTKNLFSRDQRALSHGCVRVDDPFVFADALLSTNPKLTGEGIRRMVGGKQRYLTMQNHVPVHLAYFTRAVGRDGRLVRYADVYGFDRRTQKALGL